MELRIYTEATGKMPFNEWLADLKDAKARVPAWAVVDFEGKFFAGALGTGASVAAGETEAIVQACRVVA